MAQSQARIFFDFAQSASVGTELWTLDDLSGPSQVVDLTPGSNISSLPINFINVNGTLFFTAPFSDPLLYKSDGTAAGTVPVLAYSGNPAAGYAPANLTNVDGTLFFTSTFNGIQSLWKSDGSPDDDQPPPVPGTTVVGSLDNISIFEPSFTAVGNKLFFEASDSAHGDELWMSDGNTVGILKDIIAGPQDSLVGGLAGSSYLTSSGELLFFRATDGLTNHGQELWKSDGTSVGTVIVKDIAPGIDPGTGNAFESDPSDFVDVNGILFFEANDGFGNPFFHGNELWKSDGTDAGTVMVADIVPGTGGASPHELTNVNGTLFFFANDGIHGDELWRSDGTAGGTYLVKDINLGGDSFVNQKTFLANVDGLLFFSADDGVHGVELWRSDGTPNGTFLVQDINTVTDGVSKTQSSNPSDFLNVNGKLFFTTSIGGTSTLWKADGTLNGVTPIHDIAPTSTKIGALTSFVTSVSASQRSGSLRTGDVVTFTVDLNNPVDVNTTGGTPLLILNDGGTAVYLGGSGTSHLTFRYVAQTVEHTPDLHVTSLALDGAQIADKAGHTTDVSLGAITHLAVLSTPVITSNGGGDNAAVSVAENSTGVTVATATDSDSTILSFAIDGGADAGLFVIDPTTHVLAFASPRDFEAPSNSNHDNVYQVTVRVRDSDGNSDRQNLAVAVANVSGMTIPGGDDVVHGIAENAKAAITVTASSIDTDAPIFTIAGGVDAAKFAINAVSGALAFVSPPDFEEPLDANHDNSYDVVVKATGGGASDTQTIHVSVANVSGATIAGTNKADIVDASHMVHGQKSSDEEDTLLGRGKNDKLSGLGGDDTLSGGKGRDTLTGGPGRDAFLFDAKLTQPADKVADFLSGVDHFALSLSAFKGLLVGPLSPGSFHASSHEERDDRILYNHGKLYYDADGKGGHDPLVFAKLVGHPSLAESDFIVVA